jgi:alpha-tubulin suppressor-like RCC1 family protein
MIAVGANNACVILEDATLHCWGGNNKGQLADGTTNSSAEPIQIDFDSPCAGHGETWGPGIGPPPEDCDREVLAVDVGGEGGHICAILDNGSIPCWGGNSQGQLGDGTTTDRNSPIFVDLGAFKYPTKVSTGGEGGKTCVLFNQGSVYCWGYDGRVDHDQGYYHTKNHIPTRVELDLPAIDIDAGADFACALLENHSVACWGNNIRGQVGSGDSSDWIYDPAYVALPNGRTAISISTGYDHACAVLDDLKLVCWGGNTEGQLGDGTYQSSNLPVYVDFDYSSMEQRPGEFVQVHSIESVSAALYITCSAFIDYSSGATDGHRNLACWGSGWYGQLGNGQSMHGEGANHPGFNGSNVPLLGVSWYDDHSITDLGQGPPLGGVQHVSASQRHVCVTTDNWIYCWGFNAGQLGDGSYCEDIDWAETYQDGCDQNKAKPIAVQPDWGGKVQPIPELIDTGSRRTCVYVESRPHDNAVSTGMYCWGSSYYGLVSPNSSELYQQPQPADEPISFPVEDYEIISLSISTWLNCVVLSFEDNLYNNSVYCWGYNPYGEVGDGTFENRNTPTKLTFPGGYTAIGYTDSDGDGVIDLDDRCQGHDDSVDVDEDGLIDGCDPLIDIDGDGISDNEDDFPYDSSEWIDTDGDGTGDNSDLCQGYDDAVDVDIDGIPDGCDSLIDSDNDGISDAEDQCPGYDDNDDTDGDGLANACDFDDDGDGVSDSYDLCPGSDDEVDEDSDGTPDDCDDIIDSDFDGISDTDDECDGYDDIIDIDSDGTPDGCDDFIDSDHDGYPDSTDVCPGYDDLIDQDSDGVPDGCDSIIDSDLDGVRDADDDCEGHDDSIDEDADGKPDGCEMWILTESTEIFVMVRFGISLSILFVFLSILSRRLH